MQGGCFDNNNHLHISNGSPHNHPDGKTILDYSNKKGGITVYDIPALTQDQITYTMVKARSNQSHDFQFQFNGYRQEPKALPIGIWMEKMYLALLVSSMPL